MKKKLLSVIMAVAMIASLAVPAFATGSGGAVDKNMDYSTETKTPTVTVTMPTSPQIFLNPYGMTVSVNSVDYSSQIVNPVQYIKNETAAPLKVGLKATATVAGETNLVARPCTGRETTKNAFLMVELAQAANNNTEPTWIAKMDDTDTINERAYPQIIPLTGEGKTNAAILSVDKPTTENYIAVKVLGNLAGSPTGGWTQADTANIALVFTFTPSVANAVTLPQGGNITSSKASAIMGTNVVLKPTNDVQPTVKDANDTEVAVTKVVDKVYYFTMPATAVTVTLPS